MKDHLKPQSLQLGLLRPGRRRTRLTVIISCEDFDTADAEKTAKREGFKPLKDHLKPQSFQLGLLRPGRRRTRLTVLAPLRRALLAGTQNTRAQTIPFKQDTL